MSVVQGESIHVASTLLLTCPEAKGTTPRAVIRVVLPAVAPCLPAFHRPRAASASYTIRQRQYLQRSYSAGYTVA